MLHRRLARPLDPELARLLGIEDQVPEDTDEEEAAGGMDTVVFVNEGYQIAEASIEAFPFLPSIGESVRHGGLMFKVVALVYNLEDGIVEVHVKQGV